MHFAKTIAVFISGKLPYARVDGLVSIAPDG
jgi:hypothetical protein